MTTLRRLLAALLPALLLVSLTALPAEAVGQAKYQKQARAATNAERADDGDKALKKQKCVQRFAGKQARKMAKKQRIWHQDLGRVLEQCSLGLVGENVAYGYGNGKDVVKAWMNSDGHRANILRDDYRLLGLAARKGDDGLWYAVQVFGSK